MLEPNNGSVAVYGRKPEEEDDAAAPIAADDDWDADDDEFCGTAAVDIARPAAAEDDDDEPAAAAVAAAAAAELDAAPALGISDADADSMELVADLEVGVSALKACLRNFSSPLQTRSPASRLVLAPATMAACVGKPRMPAACAIQG